MKIFNVLFSTHNVGQITLHQRLRHQLKAVRNTLIMVLSLLVMSSCASQYTAETSNMLLEKNPNLLKQEQSRLDLSMLDSSQAIETYKEVYIAPASITFSDRWLKDNRTKVSDRYIKMIKKDYAELLEKTLSKVISGSKKYVIVDQENLNSLTLNARLDDVIIYGPETISRSVSYVNHVGIATFYAEAISPNDTILAAFKDRKETTERGFLRPERTSRVQNFHDFRLLMEDWSERMLEDLER